MELDLFRLSSIVAANAPVLRMHPRDRFMPCDVDTFLEGSRLLERAEAWDDVHYSEEARTAAPAPSAAGKGGLPRSGSGSGRWRTAARTLWSRSASTSAAATPATVSTGPPRAPAGGFPSPPPEGWRELLGRSVGGDGWEGVLAAQEARVWRRARYHEELKTDRVAARPSREAEGVGSGFVAVRGGAGASPVRANAGPAGTARGTNEAMWVVLKRQPLNGVAMVGVGADGGSPSRPPAPAAIGGSGPPLGPNRPVSSPRLAPSSESVAALPHKPSPEVGGSAASVQGASTSSPRGSAVATVALGAPAMPCEVGASMKVAKEPSTPSGTGASDKAAKALATRGGTTNSPPAGLTSPAPVNPFGFKMSSSPSGRLRPVHPAIYRDAPSSTSSSESSSEASSPTSKWRRRSMGSSTRSLAPSSCSSNPSSLTLSRAASAADPAQERGEISGGVRPEAAVREPFGAAAEKGAGRRDGATPAPLAGAPSDPYDPLYAEERDLELAAELAAMLAEGCGPRQGASAKGVPAGAAGAGVASGPDAVGLSGASSQLAGRTPVAPAVEASASAAAQPASGALPAAARPPLSRGSPTREPPYPLSMLPMHFDPSFDPGRGLRLDLHPSARAGVPREDVDDVPLYAHVKVVSTAPAGLAPGAVEAGSGEHPSASVPLTLEINYLTLYAYNGPYRLGGLGAVQVGAHDGDWEHWTARVAWPSGELLGAWHSAHRARDGCWESGERVLRDAISQRPVAYVALHGHGTYPRPGRVLRHFFLGNDLCADGGVEWRPRRVVLLPVGSGASHGYGRWLGTDRWGAACAVARGEATAEGKAVARAGASGAAPPAWTVVVVPDRGTAVGREGACVPDVETGEGAHRSVPSPTGASAAPPSALEADDARPAGPAGLASPLAGEARSPAERSQGWTVVSPSGGSSPRRQLAGVAGAAIPRGLPLIVHGDPCRWLFFRGLWGETDAPICQGWFLSSECPVSRTPLLRLFGHHVREVDRV